MLLPSPAPCLWGPFVCLFIVCFFFYIYIVKYLAQGPPSVPTLGLIYLSLKTRLFCSSLFFCRIPNKMWRTLLEKKKILENVGVWWIPSSFSFGNKGNVPQLLGVVPAESPQLSASSGIKLHPSMGQPASNNRMSWGLFPQLGTTLNSHYSCKGPHAVKPQVLQGSSSNPALLSVQPCTLPFNRCRSQLSLSRALSTTSPGG